jgi:hypothetical protein
MYNNETFKEGGYLMDEGIILREKERSLFMSRVPRELKEQFIALAKAEFTEDFGLCFKWVFDQAMEYQGMKRIFFENMDMKLNEILNKLESSNPTINIPENKEEGTISLLSGKKINVRRKNE